MQSEERESKAIKDEADERARLARRVEIERELARLPARPLEDNIFVTSALVIIATVIVATILAMLFMAMPR
jgi:hypothetical protein